MKKYKIVEVSEQQLEDLIRQAPELIEPGLNYVDHQTFTPRGPLDVLFVDSGHALAVAELKVVEDDGMLVQGIDYYDYVLRNIEGFSRAYGQHKVDPKQQLRLFLVAHSFSVSLLNRIKWIDIPISLFIFQTIEFDDNKGEIVPIFKEVSAPEIPVSPDIYSLGDRYAYITDSKIRELAKQFVSEIQSWDNQKILVEPTKYDISIKISGRVLSYIGPRRKHFMVYTNDAEGKWTGYPINSASDLESIKPLVQSNYNKGK
jgi:hypothetical protein